MVKEKLIFVSALCLYIITAIFSTGFYHYDEHYQLIEFAELLAGRNTPSDLAWEYEAQIRPALQPVLAHLILQTLRMLSIDDPYVLAMILRIITGTLAVIILRYFIKKTKHLIQSNLRIWYQIVTYFLWFIPFVNVRFSSETYSGLAFILALALMYSGKKYKYLLIGILLGLSFLFRFQTAFMSMGLIIWLFINKVGLKDMLKLFFGVFLAVGIGMVIDFLFYNNLTISFYNYFVYNVVHGVASRFGISPWYFYFQESIKQAYVPLGVFIWICVVGQFFTNRKNFLLWIFVPFLLIHFLTPHKELRFLFPIINLIPLTIMLMIQYFINAVRKVNNLSGLIYVIPLYLLAINSVALILTTFCPADGEGRMNITEAIHKNYKSKNVTLWTVKSVNPYKPIPVTQNFYLNRYVNTKKFANPDSMNFSANEVNLVVLKTADMDYYKSVLNSLNLKIIETKRITWIYAARDLLRFPDNTLSLYEISGK